MAYQQLFRESERKRAIADALSGRAVQSRAPVPYGRVMPNMRVGEGLAQLGEALLARRADRQATSMFNQAEDERKQAMAAALKGTPYEQYQSAIEAGADPRLVAQMSRPEEIVSVMGDNGPEYVTQSNAVGREPYSMATQGQGSALMQAYDMHVAQAQAAGDQPKSFDEFVPWFSKNQVGAQYGTPTDVPGIGFGMPDRTTGTFSVMSPETQVSEAEAGRTAAETRAREQAQIDIQNVADLPGALAKGQEAVDTVNALINHPGRASGTGSSRNMGGGLQRFAPWASDVKDFEVLRTQAQGQVFLEAYQMLKGGGVITEVEGLKAEQAKARMDAAQSDEAYMEALVDYRDAIQRGMNILRQKALDSGLLQEGQPQEQAPPGNQPGAVNWSDL